MGCSIGSIAPDELTCNQTCIAANGKCDYKYGPYDFGMCGDCSLIWLNPATLTREIIPGQYPFFPPGFEDGSCTSCDGYQECMLGCRLAFDPGLNPPPPINPPAPPDVPLPPAPWPSANGTGFNFSVVFSDHVVLQQAPAAAAVFGQTGGPAGGAAAISVTVTPSSGSPYTVPAVVAAGRWKALLKPTPDTQGAVTFSITATCASGCTGAASVTLSDVAFGDVWYCAGQSESERRGESA